MDPLREDHYASDSRLWDGEIASSSDAVNSIVDPESTTSARLFWIISRRLILT